MIQEKDFKILIADENIKYRDSLGSRLRLAGYNVEFVTGGFHLLHILEGFKNYQLIIIHEDMLDMSAQEIVLLVRTSKTKVELPIIFISQNSDEKATYDMIISGANDYLVKTTNLQSIIDRAQKYFKLIQNT
jgi:DNA-binding response OmpR family regulator